MRKVLSSFMIITIVAIVFASFHSAILGTHGENMNGGLPYLGVREIKVPEYDVNFYNGGGFRIDIGGNEYTFESSFSYPKAGYNKLVGRDEVDQTGEAEWNVEVKPVNSSVTEVNCRGENYELNRLIIRGRHKITIRDTFRNLQNEDIGIIISNQIRVKGKVNTLYIAGMEYSETTDDVAFERLYSYSCIYKILNPTLLIGYNNTGVGVLAEDDVYRTQLSLGYTYQLNSASLSTSHFGLGPRASYTMEWSIYPLSPPDYWDFVNLVRRDLGVNFTIDGPWNFASLNLIMETPVEELRNLASRKVCRLLAIGPWFDYYDGYNMSREDFAKLVKPAIAKLKEANPNIITLFKLELPLKTLHKSQLSEYGDSVPVLQNGELSLNPQYQKEIQDLHLSPEEYGLYDAYATLENKRYKEFMSFIDFALDDCGFGGVYFDSFTGYTYGTYYTYDRWDNNTVDIDPENFTVVGKYASIALISREAMKGLVEHVQSKGGVVVANSGTPPVSSWHSVHFIGFAEKNVHVEGRDAEISASLVHLYTPVCLGDISIGDSLEEFMDDIRLQLQHGMLYYPYNYRGKENYGVLRHMFPFTPIEIHDGWLLGEERIITLKSGVYGWGDNSTIKCHLFDTDGKEIPARLFHIQSIGGKTFVSVDLGKGQIAILERGSPELRLQPPTASFTYSQQNPNDLQPVKFSDTSTAVGGEIASWYWDFGDGTYSTERNPVHTYTFGGEYTVTLWVGDDNGMINVYSLEIRVASYRIPVMVTLASLAGALIYLIVKRRRSIVNKWRSLMKYPLPKNI